jgi:hypothetical protein
MQTAAANICKDIDVIDVKSDIDVKSRAEKQLV